MHPKITRRRMFFGAMVERLAYAEAQRKEESKRERQENAEGLCSCGQRERAKERDLSDGVGGVIPGWSECGCVRAWMEGWLRWGELRMDGWMGDTACDRE